jgi:hypothetical protein
MNADKNVRSNLVIYFIFLLIAIAGIFYGHAIEKDYSFMRIWNFNNILIMCIGIPFLFLQRKAGLPDFLEQQQNRKRFLYPLLFGIAFGLADLLIFKVILHPEPYKELPPFTQPFPYSLLLYFSGAFEVEVFYRMIPLTLILLAGKWFKKGTYYMIFFWSAAVLTAMREPLEQLPDGNFMIIIYSLLTGFLMNFVQAVYYRKSGFLASLSIRLGHYLIWHILLGIYIQFIEM